MTATDKFRSAILGNPPSVTKKPDRELSVEAFGDLENRVDSLTDSYDGAYETRAQLYADLTPPENALYRVFGDSNVAYRGVYKKVGASGTGSWLYIGPLPGGDTSTLQTQITALQNGKVDKTSLTAVSAGAADATKVPQLNAAGQLAEGFLSGFPSDDIDEPTIYAHLDAFNRAGFAFVRETPENGYFSIHSNGGWVRGQIEAGNDTDIAWAAPYDQYGRSPMLVRHDGAIITNSGILFPSIAGSGAFSQAEIDSLGAWALAESALIIANGINPFISRFTYNLYWTCEYGQSLSTGGGSHPPKTVDPIFNNVMVGDSVRSVGVFPDFTPYGGVYALKPLVANVTQTATDVVLTPAEVEALDWLDGFNGETISVGFANFSKFLWNQYRAVSDDADRAFVVTSTGRGSSSLADLSSGYRFDRTVNAAARIKTLGDAASKTTGIGVILWAQGENDAAAGTTKATYKTNARALFNSVSAAAMATFNQTLKPLIMIYQTSGDWVPAGDMPVSQAQLELALEEDDIVMYAPAYPVTNKSDGHLDGNGARWMGMQAAKVWYRTIVMGQGWEPTHIKKALMRSNEILLAYHVPVPPLAFRNPYVGFTATDYETKGFAVYDNNGLVPLSSVSINGKGAVVLLKLGRVPVGPTYVRYASSLTGGNGNIADSDTFQTLYNYNYDLAAGDDPIVNVAALVDKMYPAYNFATLQVIQAEQV